MSPLTGRPSIAGGKYDWCMGGKLVELDFFYPELSLAVRVAGSHHRPYSQAKDFVPSRKFWEARTEEDAFVVDMCQRTEEVRLLLITPDDPVDPFSISVKLREILSK